MNANVFTLFDWHPNSPDLIPMENLWGWLKQEVKKENPRSIKEFRNNLNRNWERITLDFIRNYIDSFASF